MTRMRRAKNEDDDRGTDTPRFLRGLNEEQRRAVEFDGGPVAVLAGPGTGKTRVIVHRVARLAAPVEEGGAGAAPGSILALAFTIKSAQEMRDRIGALVDPPLADGVRAETCHAFGRRIVRRFGDVLGLPPEPEVMHSAQRKRLLRDLIRAHDLFASFRAVGIDALTSEAAAFIDKCRDAAVTPERATAWCDERAARLASGDHGLDEQGVEAERARLAKDADLARAYERYESEAVRRGLITLGDYIDLPIRVLRADARAAAILRDEIRHIVVDEFQDWNPAQIELLSLLAPPRAGAGGPDLCVVGDDDQSIYAFRGADDRAFQHFSERWSGHETIRLETNYRSAPHIINVANSVLTHAHERFAPDKVIRAFEGREANPPEGVDAVVVDHDDDTGAVIAAMILSDQRENPGRALSSYAVIGRFNAFLERVGAELEVQGLRVDMRRTRTPLDDPGVEDVLCWVRLVVDPADSSSARRLLVRRPFLAPIDDVNRWLEAWRTESRARGKEGGAPRSVDAHLATVDDDRARRFAQTMLEIRTSAAEHTADRAFMTIIHRTGVAQAETLPARERAERIANLAAAVRFVRTCVPRLDPPGDLLAFWSYYNDLDDDERKFVTHGDERVDVSSEPDGSRPDAVTVITAHSAKGLEFEHVFAVRVRKQHGFGDTRNAPKPEETLSEALTGRPNPDWEDEELRLFYVACTRAQRRLTLIAKRKAVAKKLDPRDYFQTLTAHTPELGIPVREGAHVLEAAGLARPSELDAESAPGGSGAPSRLRMAWIERESARLRADAGGAVFEANRSDLTPDDVERLSARLRGVVARLATLARLRVECDGSRDPNAPALPPALAPDDPMFDDLRDYEAAARARAADPDTHDDVTRPLKPPLYLSYSSVKDFLDCPRCYYFKHVLRLDEPKTAALGIGSAAHEALERYFKEVQLAESEGEPAPGLKRLHELGDDALDRSWPRHLERDEDLARQLDALLRNAHAMHEPDAQVLEIERAEKFPYEVDGVRHTFVAKIDRLDLLPNGAFRIVDYKSGKAAKYLLEPDKDDLQLCVYLMALRHMQQADGDGAIRGAAEYWVISTGQRGTIGFDALKVDKAREKIDDAVRKMLRGEFPRNEKSCKGICQVFGE